MGVWLPISLASIYTVLVAIVRMLSAKPADVSVPALSEVLKGWALPVMGEAMAADEKEQAAIRLIESVRTLARRKGEKSDV